MTDAAKPEKTATGRTMTNAEIGSVSARFNRHIKQAQTALFVERLWPKTVPALSAANLFLSASWLGLWAPMPAGARMAGVLTFAAAALAGPLFAKNGSLKIGKDEALERLDHNLGDPLARPARTLSDKLHERSSAREQAIWNKHITQIWDEWGDQFKGGKPFFNRPGHGKYKTALAASLALAVAAGGIAGENRMERLQDAFNWTGIVPAEQPLKVQAWVKPPRYIEGELYLTEDTKDHTQGGDKLITSQYGTMTIQVFDRKTTVTVNGEELPLQNTLISGKGEEQKTVYQYEAQLMDPNTVIAVKGGPTWHIEVTPDQAPTVDIKSIKPNQENPGALEIIYGTSDDHGITGGEIKIKPAGAKENPGATPLPSSKLPALPLP